MKRFFVKWGVRKLEIIWNSIQWTFTAELNIGLWRAKFDGKHGNLGVENVKSMNAGSTKYRALIEFNSRGVNIKIEGEITVIMPNELAISEGGETFGARSAKVTCLMAVTKGEILAPSRERKKDSGVKEGSAVSDFGLFDLWSDEGTSIEILDALKEERSKTMGNGFEVGDMVWGKVKSHPWWPGQIFNEALASHEVCDTKSEGCVLVAFYGDCSYAWFDPVELIPFTPHYTEKSKQSNARLFLTAVEEAVDEVCRRAALGLACHCRNPFNVRPTNVQGFFEVDVSGYEPGGLYSKEQIEKAREDFQPLKALSFLQQSAVDPLIDLQIDIKWMKNVAQFLAYRKATYEEFDVTYAQAFGVQVQPGQEKALAQASPSAESMMLKTQCGFVNRVKVKDPRDKKLRDEPKFSRIHHFSKSSGDHVPKKRAPPAVIKPKVGWKKNANTSLNPFITGKEVIPVDKKPELSKVPGESKPLNAVVPLKLLGRSSDGVNKKPNILKRPREYLNSKNSNMGERKMKTKEESLLVGGPEHSYKGPKPANIKELARKPSGKSSGTSLHHRKGLQINQKHEGNGTISSISSELPSSANGLLAVARAPFENPPRENLWDLPSAFKPLKKRPMPDIPVEAGKKCGTSNCQEEMSMKAVKGLNEMKSLAAEKRAANQKPLKIKGEDEKGIGATVSVKPLEDSIKEPETLPMAAERTMLIIRFPPRTTLPSVSELKARFARFGSLDKSAIRVFWVSSTCRVVFMYKSDAQAAYSHAVRNGTLFGNTKVSYCLRAFEGSASKLPESGKSGKCLMEEAVDKVPPLRSVIIGDSAGEPRSTAIQQLPLHPNVQLKSCLKKLDDGMGSTTSAATETPPPKSILGGNGSEWDRSTVNDHIANFQQVEAKNSHNYQTNTATATTNSVDISHQMLNLLSRCSEIVADVERSFGHVPYHAL